MKQDDEKNLVQLTGFLKQGIGFFAENAGKVIASITLLVASVVTFTDIGFSGVLSEEFTITLFVMLFSSYLMYFSLQNSGEREGEKSDEYISAEDAYLKIRKEITPNMIEPLRDFCLSYSAKELEYRRQNYLCENGLSAKDYENYKNGGASPKRIKKILKKASLMKAVNLTPVILLSRSHFLAQSELQGPQTAKRVSTLLTLIPSTICTIFTVSIILTTKENMTVSSVLDGLMKLSALPIVGFKGFMDGYCYSKDAKTSWIEVKTRLLEEFLSKNPSIKTC